MGTGITSNIGDRVGKDEKTRVLSDDQRSENNCEISRAIPVWIPKLDSRADWFLSSTSQLATAGLAKNIMGSAAFVEQALTPSAVLGMEDTAVACTVEGNILSCVAASPSSGCFWRHHRTLRSNGNIYHIGPRLGHGKDSL